MTKMTSTDPEHIRCPSSSGDPQSQRAAEPIAFRAASRGGKFQGLGGACAEAVCVPELQNPDSVRDRGQSASDEMSWMRSATLHSYGASP